MAGPWETYQSGAQDSGPWAEYAKPATQSRTPKEFAKESPSNLSKVAPFYLGPAGPARAVMDLGAGLEKLAYEGGGIATDIATRMGASPETAAGAGYVTNVALGLGPSLVSGSALARAGKSAVDFMSRSLLSSALKPPKAAVQSGDATRAIDDMLKYGINVSKGGKELVEEGVAFAEKAIGDILSPSNKKIDPQQVVSYLGQLRSRFGSQVNPDADLAVIDKVKEGFINHPYFKNLDGREQQLLSRILDKEKSKVSALQEAGKFLTQRQQQAEKAEQFFPVEGMPRISGRYSHNIERVPEATGAYNDALVIARQRAREKAFLENQLSALRAEGTGLPVDIANEMKKGTYRQLKGKYGEIGSAETEAQKALARGLRGEIGKAEPRVAALLKGESSAMNMLSLLDNRLATEFNKNPLGLGWLGENIATAAGFMVDRSALAKSLIARGIHSGGQNALKFTGGVVPMPYTMQTPDY